jgi:hypothetical protein
MTLKHAPPGPSSAGCSERQAVSHFFQSSLSKSGLLRQALLASHFHLKRSMDHCSAVKGTGVLCNATLLKAPHGASPHVPTPALSLQQCLSLCVWIERQRGPRQKGRCQACPGVLLLKQEERKGKAFGEAAEWAELGGRRDQGTSATWLMTLSCQEPKAQPMPAALKCSEGHVVPKNIRARRAFRKH